MAVLAVGCSGQKAPSSPGGTTSTAPSSSPGESLPHSGAPRVSNPLPASVIGGDPCQSMTADQLKDALGQIQRTKPGTNSGVGPGCTWSNLDTDANLDVSFDSGNNSGLSGWYENTKPQAVVWKELTVQGFPAVAHVTPSGGDPKDFCQISVGINDRQTVDVTIGLSDSKKGNTDPCQVTVRAADVVVANLKRNAGS
nr:DUF3558 domain-containing protein [Amycolatopsis sulphurea]